MCKLEARTYENGIVARPRTCKKSVSPTRRKGGLRGLVKTLHLQYNRVAKNAGELTHVVHRNLQLRFCNRHITRVDLAQNLVCMFIGRRDAST